LLMVGDGEQKQEAFEKLKTLSCQNQITLVPFRNDVPTVLAAADIYVLPSLWEGLSIALLEAMSMGKAIIATKTDGTVELLTNQESGLLVNIDNLVE
jgi:glycosyltransferase involved in cell wall biosynthesis